MLRIKLCLTLAVSPILLAFSAFAATTTLIGTKGEDFEIMTTSDGQARFSTGAATTFNIQAPGTKARLYVVTAGGKFGGPVIAAVRYRGLYFTYLQARGLGLCALSGAELILGVSFRSSIFNLGRITYLSDKGYGYFNTLLSPAKYDKYTAVKAAGTISCSPAGTGKNLGLLSKNLRTRARSSRIKISSNGEDSDGDGIVDRLDIDSDNDGILNAYDQSTPLPVNAKKFSVFSSLRLDIDQSLNAYTQTLTTQDTDTAASNLSLNYQLVGTRTDKIELNCNNLTYCSSDGTGVSNSKLFPDEFDSDNDGLGLMTRSSKNTFQLSPNVSSTDEIGAGDLYSETVTTGSSVAAEIPSLLNFVFLTTPAISSLTVGSAVITPAYPAAAQMLGSVSNPFMSPVGWDGKLSITAFRPQRFGIKNAGEGRYVDIGNSLVSVNIANKPCTGSDACTNDGPGNCDISSYYALSSRLHKAVNTLKDMRGDASTQANAAATNALKFSIDLNQCLALTKAGAITWNVGEKIGIELQFRNTSGDITAQKFYLLKQ